MMDADLNGASEHIGNHHHSGRKSDQVKRGKKRKRSSRKSEAKVNGDNGSQDPNEFEVEGVVGHRISPMKIPNQPTRVQVTYNVKWKGWGPESNTWERAENLRNSLETLVEYHENLLSESLESNSQVTAFKHHLLKDITPDDIDRIANLYIRPKGDCFPVIDEDELNERMTLLARLPSIVRDQKVVKELKHDYLILEVIKRRKFQIENLKQWESEINRASTDSAPIRVENEVDLDLRPLDFKYINKCTLMNLKEQIVMEPLTGCDCTNCGNGRCECAGRDGSVMGYNSMGLLKVPKGTAIYECTALCKCGPECPNRVLQKGRSIPLCIFKTNNGCGWGVKTLANIQKGQFVTEYVGEVISQDESDRRGKLYTREGRTYLFDLDFHDTVNCKYTIDAAEYGNVSHFINHSCGPNLEVRAVYVNCIDASLPRLGLFAIRNINAHDEITFDYLCVPVDSSVSRNDSSADPKAKVLCKCEHKNCRKYLF